MQREESELQEARNHQDLLGKNTPQILAKQGTDATLVDEIIDSIVNPGVNMRIFGIIQYVFALLQVTLLVLLYLSSFSLHVLFLNISSGLLWITLNWSLQS